MEKNLRVEACNENDIIDVLEFPLTQEIKFNFQNDIFGEYLRIHGVEPVTMDASTIKNIHDTITLYTLEHSNPKVTHYLVSIVINGRILLSINNVKSTTYTLGEDVIIDKENVVSINEMLTFNK